MRALALALVACGPVAATAPEHPAETTARRALAAALRQALVEACRATTPTPDSHPAVRIAWAAVCSTAPQAPAMVTTDAARRR